MLTQYCCLFVYIMNALSKIVMHVRLLVSIKISTISIDNMSFSNLLFIHDFILTIYTSLAHRMTNSWQSRKWNIQCSSMTMSIKLSSELFIPRLECQGPIRTEMKWMDVAKFPHALSGFQHMHWIFMTMDCKLCNWSKAGDRRPHIIIIFRFYLYMRPIQ